MLRKKILVIMAFLAACLFFYLLALDSYCDEGGHLRWGFALLPAGSPGEMRSGAEQFSIKMSVPVPGVLRCLPVFSSR
ncbi:Uncharacterised protein [Serratia proteamaculans]|nr:Uncharacterised protein [Serratia proteamaculans]